MTAADAGAVWRSGPVPVEEKAGVRVLVVDDSAIVRGLISRHLESDPEIRVIGSAANGEIALAELARRATDVVVLDIEMPVMDGLTALPRILALNPMVKVIMVSSLTRRNAEISLRALNLGAADYVAKPEAGLGSAENFRQELVSKVKALGGAAATMLAAPVASPMAASALRSAPAVLAIGSSTGGPPALLKLFESLRGAVAQPILITQHMPPTFTTLLAEQLARAGDRPCREGIDSEIITPGQTYIAPGGWHMVVERGVAGPVIRLNQDPPENYCRPAVDPLFRSLATVYGKGVLGLILTGMGADGAKGCQALAQVGGRFVVQDAATSVVWGMPGAAAQTGLAEQILPLDQIGPWLRRATEKRS